MTSKEDGEFVRRKEWKRGMFAVIPNFLITNRFSHALTKDECGVLKYGFKHGLATCPKENDI